MVYEDAEKLYAQVKKDGEELIQEAFNAILGFPSSDARTQPVSGNFIGFNTTPFPRRDVVKVPFAGPQAAKLKSKLVQTTKDGKEGYALMDCATGGRLSSSCGMFADCHPVSGTREIFLLTACSLKPVRQSTRTDRIISCLRTSWFS